ncbi:type II toxin-antitoxin system RelE/ParE family toxin [Rossellomorea aquimaris]|uniref:Plasmid stabilization system protein ParE n=1 Tax=Rossellomorea aquimaris TaxID=189382 RepID=A0A366EH93_9BACI|nr:type II toxin-antitoxin system RelE/ParE family toxin [Rossellomorea aquimaris]RBP00805.1 plasmid stabilization system protein ParE [Rossellomorea aquimaris]
MSRNVVWTPIVREKLTEFRSKRFTPIETLDYISQVILETEDLLKNPVIGKTYTEEFGKYKGISRIVVRKFQFYFRIVDHEVLIIAALFPGENK